MYSDDVYRIKQYMDDLTENINGKTVEENESCYQNIYDMMEIVFGIQMDMVRVK